MAPTGSRLAILAALVLMASSVSAQSLGDVARQEEARRSAVKAASKAKVLTNADLSADPTAVDPVAAPSAEAASSVAVAAVTAAASTSAATDSAAAVTAAAPEVKLKEDEGLWRKRAVEHRARLAGAQKKVDSLLGAAPKTDQREQGRTDLQIKRAQEELRRADEAQRLLIMQADVAGIPVTWIK